MHQKICDLHLRLSFGEKVILKYVRNVKVQVLKQKLRHLWSLFLLIFVFSMQSTVSK